MRSLSAIGLFAWSILVTCTAWSQSAICDCQDTPVGIDPCCMACRPSPEWYGRAEALFWKRDKADRRAISADIENWSGVTTILMTTDSANFDFEPGTRITLGKQFGCNALEFSYLGFSEFDARAQVTSADAPNGTLQSALAGYEVFVNVAPFDGADLHRINYRSNLHNAEINFRHQAADGPRFGASWLAGFRYINISEQFDFDTAANDFMGAGPASGIYGTRTENNLFGAQLGGDLAWHCTPKFLLGACAKGGLLGNWAVERQFLGFYLPPPGGSSRDDSSASACRVSSVVEAGLFGVLQVTPRIKLRGGYDVMMVGGLALAPAQLNFGDDPDARATVKHQGSTIYHGPSCGLEIVW